MSSIQRNLFRLTEPERYRCQVLHYHKRLSRLYLSIFLPNDEQNAIALLFADVAYFDCPVNWQSANFTLRPDEECVALLLETGLIGEAVLHFPGAYASLTEHVHLYEVPGEKRSVRIIAGSVTRLQQIPAELQG